MTACLQIPWLIVLCEYSKFWIESNSYLLFDSIRNWRNYSKFSNTYLTVISWATETRFVCSLPATSCRTRLSVEPSAAPRVCATPPTPLTALTTHGSRAWAVAPVRACVLPAPGLDRDIWWHYNSGRQTPHSQLSAGLSVSIVMDSTLTLRHAAFKVCGDTGPANVILSLSLAHAACQKNHLSSATAMHCIAIVADW